MTPIRWRILATHVPPGGALGGVVRYTLELVAALARRDDVALEIVATREASATLREASGGAAAVHSLRAGPQPLLPVRERYATVALPAPDVVHGVKHLVPRRHTSALRVLTVHDMILLDRTADFGTVKRALLPKPYRASIRDADLLLCVSDATRQALARHDPAAARRGAVTPLATAGRLLTATPAPLPSLADRVFALVVGDAGPRKNVGTIVDAWPRVREALPEAVLAIAGPPAWGRTERGRAYAGLVAEGALVPLGQVSDPQLRWAYEHSAVVLCPSLTEGFGLPVVEALDLGASVLVSDDPAQQEAAAGRARSVVPAEDAGAWATQIIQALQGQHDAFDTSTAGTRRTWDDVAADSVGAVREALARRSATTP